MRFMFSLISNITYTIFCLCIEYIILYVYGIFLSSTPSMLSVKIVTMLLLASVFAYSICFVLMMIFGIEKFASENDNLLQLDKEKPTSARAPVAVPQKTDDYKRSANRGTSHISVQTLCVVTILMCHITLMTSLCTIIFVTLYECIQDAQSIQCILTWGNHGASQGIAITIALIMLSILIPLLNLYKVNSSGTKLFDKYVATYLTFYVFFTHIVLETNLMEYQQQCLSSVHITDNVDWYYAALCVHLLYHFVVVTIVNVYAPQSTVVVYTEVLAAQFEKWTVVMSTLGLLLNTGVFIFFIAYGYHTSAPFNFIQTICLSIYVISTTYHILFVKQRLTVKTHAS